MIHGIETDIAANGNEGLTFLKTNRYDWVLTDIIMPEKDGLEFIIVAKNRYPTLKIIAMSGGGKIRAQYYLNMAALLNTEEILHKPFEIKTLLSHLA